MSGQATPRRLGRGERGWPPRLEHLGRPPDELWIRGRLPAPGTAAIAVVGSRRATPGGLLTAHDLGGRLASAGITVVSGMARGIDAAAHRGALDGGGETIAVLGCGIDVCYPPEHSRLRDGIAAHGCLLSEDGGDAPPVGWRFPRRNRLIAALAEVVIVVEATSHSGALSTARWAVDLGREVLAVPGSIRSPSSQGTNLLIRDGARPYLEFRDVLDAVPGLRRAFVAAGAGSPPTTGGSASGPPVLPRLGPAGASPAPVSGGPASVATPTGEDDVLSRVLDGLGPDPVHPDDLGVALGLPSAVVVAALTTLNLRGAVTDVCGGRVARMF